jgi:Reverse transcriptase (RNA-dependent DNA polymerase)
VAHTKGSPTKERYNCATVFVDHYSDVSFVHLQGSLSGDETLEAKQAFEHWSHNITIKHYHADNGRFAETKFLAAVAAAGQTISFCGVNAHFQNGKAERRIRTLQDLGRTQLLHAMARWPVAISTHLWPYAVTNVANCQNDMRQKDKKETRLELFSGSKISPNLKNHHHVGIPVYVLDNSLQAGMKIPKWMPRARVGIYLGRSPRHARNVALVLNPRTGLVSAQFHIRFDDTFETVRGTKDELHSLWKTKCGFTREKHRSPIKKSIARISKDKTEQSITPENVPVVEEGNEFLMNNQEQPPDNPLVDQEIPPQLPIRENEGANIQDQEDPQPVVDNQASNLRRSTRQRQPTRRMLESVEQETMSLPVSLQIMKYDPDCDTFLDYTHPIALAATNDPDTMYWDQALKQEDREEFIKAAIQEISTHQEQGHWKVIPRENVPAGTKVLDAVWSMKRKRRLTTNEVYKHKACLNVHGGQQEHGINYWETYAPVVTWASIRLLLILTIMYGWHTKQIDFVLAYPQADVECDIFMRIPKDFTIEGKSRDTHVLQLVKNLYGQKQAGRVWNQHLHSELLRMGWTQSSADECVYYKGKVIFLVYVDDGILISPSEEGIDSALTSLQATFKISVEGSLSDYVGVNVERTGDNEYHLSQPNIINSILKELNFNDDTKPVSTPALATVTLGTGEGKEKHKADWSYRRLVGKLNFLAASCRPKISCAVHQAARYSSDPRINHTEAIKRLARYLKANPEKGMYLRPTGHSFEVYADADFCGLWNIESPNKPVSAKSRTGYIIMYGGCPIIWASQLQTEISLSMTEAEYVALSTALRNTIPLMRLVNEIREKLQLPMDTVPKVHCKAFEDNSGAVELSTVPKLRPHTKHINTKYHHFRQYVHDKLIKIQQIATIEQVADIFTKNLPESTFLKFRNRLLGW